MKDIFSKIHKITLPTGFAIGDVNVYLIEDDPVTLVDTGVNGAISEHIFTHFLNRIGLSFSDIKRIVITHTHLDHCGMAGTLQDLSGAELLVFRSKTEDVANFNESLIKKPKSMKGFWTESAVPEGLLSRSLRTWHKSICLGSNANSVSPLDDGDTIATENLKLNVIHTPGHSDDMICLYEKDSEILFSSDHITLETNPSLRLREIFQEKDGLLGNMSDYFESLEKIEALDISKTLPGHGESFGSPGEVIAGIKKTYLERKEVIAKILKHGSLNRFELTRALFGFLNDREIFRGLPEVSGHLEILEREGRLSKFSQNGVIYYSVAR